MNGSRMQLLRVQHHQLVKMMTSHTGGHLRVVHMDIPCALRPASNMAANSVWMPPNNSTKIIPVSGGRHKMGHENLDGPSGIKGVV